MPDFNAELDPNSGTQWKNNAHIPRLRAWASLLDSSRSVTLSFSGQERLTQAGGARMATAAVTPRVRTIVICDDVSASLTENGVFTLEGVRLHLEAESFPCRAALRLFLLLSSPRKGRYSGKILVVNERSDRAIRYVKFLTTFQDDNELLPLYVDVGDCVFPAAGLYTFEIYFSAPGGGEALKGEHPFTVRAREE
jgi:hypothetical protein